MCFGLAGKDHEPKKYLRKRKYHMTESIAENFQLISYYESLFFFLHSVNEIRMEEANEVKGRHSLYREDLYLLQSF